MSWFNWLKKDETTVESPKVKQPFNVEKDIKTKVESTEVHVDLINSEHLFYDLLFGEDADSVEVENTLEKEVVERVNVLLLDPKTMVFEPFPKPLREALAKIDSGASLDQIELSINQDPVLASNILKLANTAAFKRTERNVTNLKTAINFVGLTSIKQLVTVAAMISVMKICPIYFKVFGEKIWQHSVITARLCELAAKDLELDPYDAFFIGLIHDLGKIAIFKTLVGAMQHSLPGMKPGSVHFRHMMTSMSKQLTVSIVRHWELPEEVIEPLEQHVVHKVLDAPNPLTKILVESKLLSELCLLLEAHKLTEPEAQMILSSHDINPDKLELIKNVKEFI